MKLIGSHPSPFVRRIRVLLYQLKQPFEFETLSIFSEAGQEQLAKYSKTARIPILIDGDQTIWDSLLITKHLLIKYSKQRLSLEDEKELVLINEANNSAVILYQMRLFRMDENWSSDLALMNLRRFEQILEHFNLKYAVLPKKLEIKDVWLYCMLDWLNFREIYDWRKSHANLVTFVDRYQSEQAFVDTVPQ